MTNQVLFLFGLYGFGLFFGLLFKRQLPVALISLTGFLWGALAWVIGGVLILAASLPYTPVSMGLLFIFLMIGFGTIHARNKTWRLARRELLTILLIAAAFLLVLVLASLFNFSTTSQDSIAQISTGRRIAYEGFSSPVIEELSLRGIYLPQLHSASVFLGDDYLYAAQPAFAFSFVLIFVYLTRRIIGHLSSHRHLAWLLSLSSGLILFSTYFIVFQFFYIHNNLISALYLYFAVCAFWLAAVEERGTWAILGIIALLGFSLARNEAPIFALIFLVLVVSSKRISFRVRLRSMLPYLVVLILWYLYLLLEMGQGTKILDPGKTLLIIGTLAAFGCLVLLSELKWIKSLVLPHLPKVMLGTLLVLLVVMAILKPNHMILSVWIIINNTLEAGGWGITWLIFGFLLVLSMAGPRLPWEEIFFVGISSFVALLLALVYFRNPYRLGWGDSANRMLTHILPIIILYVSMKAAEGFSGSGPDNNHATPEISQEAV